MLSVHAKSSLAVAFLLSNGAFAQQPPQPTVDPDGTVRGSVVAAPVSSFLSPEGKAALAKRLREEPSRPPMANPNLATVRQGVEASATAALSGWLKIYPSNIEDTTIDGVRVLVITPKDGVDPRNRQRVLIGAHQGGFVFGGAESAKAEGVPLSGRGRIKVIAVDYRMGPEARFPAASEDMEKVYSHVLKSTAPANVGLFGCSAGGTLVAQSLAWFQKQNLPTPGAASIMCSGALDAFWFGGDSNTTMAALNARATPPAAADSLANKPGGYFDGIEQTDPLVTPGLYPAVLSKFPPTLVVSGTRDVAMSNAIMTHTALLKADTDAHLFVQEGMGHGFFIFMPGIPESMVAYDVLWKFFDRNLGR